MTLLLIVAAILLVFVNLSGMCPSGLAWTSLRTALAAGGLVVLLTECLNATIGLTTVTVASSWAAVSFGLGIVAWWRRDFLSSQIAGIVREVAGWFRGSSRGSRFLSWFLLVWFVILLVVALVAAPNNHDSLTYRLPRVMQWADAGSVDFFQTQVLRQNTRPPVSEWTTLHLYLVSGTDRFFNLIQWASFVLCTLAAVELARLLGADGRGRRFAALLVATTPLAILQSTSTQNDLLCSFFAMAFVCFGWQMATTASGKVRWMAAAFCGLATGLAILAKPTLLVILAPGGAFLAGMALFRSGVGALAPGLAGVLIALVLASGHAARNFALSGTPLGPESETIQRLSPPGSVEQFDGVNTNERISPSYLASNVSRNLAVVLSGPMEGFNDLLVWATWRIHELIGVGVDVPAITNKGMKFHLLAARHEDVAGHFPQAAAFFLALLFIVPAWRRHPAWVIYAACIIIPFIALSGILRWETWHTRIFLPLVLLGCPLAATALPLARLGRIFPAVCGALIVYAVPFLTENDRRPILGEKSVFAIPRRQQFTRGNWETYYPMSECAREIRRRGYESVGLLTEVDDQTYPFWAYTKVMKRSPVQIYQIDPRNLSRHLPRPPKPEAVLATFGLKGESLDTIYGPYDAVWREGRYILLEPRAAE